MKFNKKIVSTSLATMLMISLITGCSSTKEQALVKKDKTQLNVAGEQIPATLDSAIDWDGWYTVRFGVTQTLVKVAQDGSYEPWLAKSWYSNEDKTSWTFELREGIKFSNGELLTPTKVKQSFERLYEINDPANGGVGNPQGYFEYTSIEVDDDKNTVTINTKQPVVDMLGCMAYPWSSIIDVEATEGVNTKIEGVIGTGPYVIEEFVQDSSISFSSNKNYWAGEVHFETLNYVYIPDSRTRTMALQDKSADLTMNLVKTDRDTIKKDESNFTQIVAGNRIGMGHMNLNGVLANKDLRKAITMAIDSETIASITTGETYNYSPYIVPTNYDYGSEDLVFNESYNKHLAIKLLDDANIIDTNNDGIREIDGENIVLDYKVMAVRSLDIIAQAQIGLLREIGIDVDMKIVDSISEILKSRNFDIVTVSEVTMPTGDPQQYLSHWYSKSNDNYSGYINEEYDKIYEQLLSTVDEKARKELIKNLQQLVLDDTVCIVYGFYTTNMAASDSIEGVVASTSDFYWITDKIKPAQ